MLRGKLKLALIASIVIAVCGILIYSPAVKVLAAETTINIVDKAGEIAVTTITFPEGAPLDTVSAPFNNVNGDADPQVLAAAPDSEPVVRLHNTSGGPLFVTLQITDWLNGVVTSEYYELVDTTTTNIEAVATQLSEDGQAAIVPTGISIDAGEKKDLYLAVDLSGLAGKSGTSTITILGEVGP